MTASNIESLGNARRVRSPTTILCSSSRESNHELASLGSTSGWHATCIVHSLRVNLTAARSTTARQARFNVLKRLVVVIWGLTCHGKAIVFLRQFFFDQLTSCLSQVSHIDATRAFVCRGKGLVYSNYLLGSVEIVHFWLYFDWSAYIKHSCLIQVVCLSVCPLTWVGCVQVDHVLLISCNVKTLIYSIVHPRWLKTVPLQWIGTLVSFWSLFSVIVLIINGDPAIVLTEQAVSNISVGWRLLRWCQVCLVCCLAVVIWSCQLLCCLAANIVNSMSPLVMTILSSHRHFYVEVVWHRVLSLVASQGRSFLTLSN